MNLRNLEQIQEQERGSRGLPLGTLLLAAAGGGALVVVLMTTLEREAPPAESKVDPLQQLVEEASRSPSDPAAVVKDQHVTFPGLLSDRDEVTTAMAAVKDERGRLLKREGDMPSEDLPHAVPSPVASALPKAPLPVGDLLSSTPVTQAPKDELSQLAKSTNQVQPNEMAPAGMEGGYEIQVASFQNVDDANALVEELRKRGHRAYRQAAYVPERGLWHRVRIGPFKAKYKALAYQSKLEEQERMPTFLVDPDKVKRQKAIRDAKLAAREKKAERHKERLERAKKRAEQ